jgi:two-component system, chemotaxis family, chemotaxis protein CheY
VPDRRSEQGLCVLQANGTYDRYKNRFRLPDSRTCDFCRPNVVPPMALDLSTKVLIVEDNPNLRKVIVNIVKKIGYTDVVEAEDGTAAWKVVEDGNVGLVLTDWAMPGMTGIDLLKKIRAAKAPTNNLPILMITAADTKDSILTAGKEGVDAYIIKPFSVKTIVDKIQEAVEHRSKL